MTHCLEPPVRIDIRSERGASAVEYGILISAIAAVLAATVYLFGGTVMDLFDRTCDELASAQQETCA